MRSIGADAYQLSDGILSVAHEDIRVVIRITGHQVGGIGPERNVATVGAK